MPSDSLADLKSIIQVLVLILDIVVAYFYLSSIAYFTPTTYAVIIGACILFVFLAVQLTKRFLPDGRESWFSYRALASRFVNFFRDVKLRWYGKRLKSNNNFVRDRAAESLGKIGTDKAANLLELALRAERVRYIAETIVEALENIGTDKAARRLREALVHEDYYVRKTAVEALGKIGSDEAVDGLRQALTDQDPSVAKSAVEALEKVGTDKASDALKLAPTNQDRYVRKTAVEALGKIGSDEAVDGLRQALTDDDSYVLGATVTALENIGTDKAVGVLRQGLRHKNEYVRRGVVKALDNLAWKPDNDTDEAYHLIAIGEWHELAKMGERAVQPLIQALLNYRYVYHNERDEIAETLGNIRDTRARPSLIQVLTDADESVRIEAAKALGKVGDFTALEPLIHALGDRKDAVRSSAAKSLGQLGFKKPADALRQALNDQDSRVRYEAAQSLEMIGWKPVSHLEQIDCFIAAQRWEKVEELGEPAIPPLIRTLSDFDRYVEEKTTSALAKIALHAGEPAISQLIEAFRVEDSHVRSSLSLALGKIGEQARPLLTKGLKDGDPNVVEGTMKALTMLHS
jgi:HEAT repeat protein